MMHCSDCEAALPQVGARSFLAFPNGRGGFCCGSCSCRIWGEEQHRKFRVRRSVQERFAARRHRKSVLGFWCAVSGAALGAALAWGAIWLIGWLL